MTMTLPARIAAALAALLLAAGSASGQSYELLEPDPTRWLIRFRFESADPDDGGIWELDHVVEAYTRRLAAHVERVVGDRGSVRKSGVHDVVVVIPYGDGTTIPEVRAGPQVEPVRFCLAVTRDEAADGVEPVDMEAARAALAARLAEHAGSPPSEVDVSDLAPGMTETSPAAAPDRTYRWVCLDDNGLAMKRGGEADFAEAPLAVDDYRLIVLDASGEAPFGARDLRTVHLDAAWNSERVVGLELRADRAPAFGRFTEAAIGRSMAILVGDRLLQPPPMINDRLFDHFVLTNGTMDETTREQAAEMLLTLKQAAGFLERSIVYEGPYIPVHAQ